MDRRDEIRPGEVVVTAPAPRDAGLVFIGRIHTPWQSRSACPRQGRQDGPICRIEIFEPWVAALKGIEKFAKLEVLYWLDRSRRDLVQQNPKHSDQTAGTFALRSPMRPNPIGTSLVKLERVEENSLFVRGLDCLDGTPLVDLKPDHCHFSADAVPQPEDFQKR
jgi:tRNA-Thr(GGU) m(6)t(6)A37 methyltransferase TsaA